MTDLLPPIAARKLKRDRSLRFFSIFLIFAALALFILAIFSLPVSVLQKYQLSSIREDGEFTEEVEDGRKKREEESVKIQTLITHINSKSKTINFSETISRIDTLAGEGVYLTNFSFDSKNKITITGRAATRTDLSDFRDRLNNEKDFSSVELPLTSLVNEKDALFTITLTIK